VAVDGGDRRVRRALMVHPWRMGASEDCGTACVRSGSGLCARRGVCRDGALLSDHGAAQAAVSSTRRGHRSQDDARAHPPRDDALRRTGFADRRPFSCGHSVGYAVCFTIRFTILFAVRFTGGTDAALIFAPVRIGFDLRLVKWYA
jgi:hypothetical protein